MKNLLAALLLVVSVGAIAFERCTYHDYEIDGRRYKCETCCDSFGCKTKCRER